MALPVAVKVLVLVVFAMTRAPQITIVGIDGMIQVCRARGR